MGIKDLFKYITDNHPEVIEFVPLSSFEGKKIAIDGNLLLKKHWSVFSSEYIDVMDVRETKLDERLILMNTVQSILRFINILLSFKITPVFIFDGGMQPEKEETCKERREKVKKCKTQLDGFLKELEDQLDTSIIEKKIRSSWKVISNPTATQKEYVRDLFSSLGIPVLLSLTDGEKLCCSLYLEGQVQAVFAEDSDCIPFGCFDLFIKITKTDEGERVFRHINLVALLQKLDLTFEQMVDVCILSGCDYSKRPKGFSVPKSIERIRELKDIEGVVSKFGIKCEYQETRDIFKYKASSELTLNDCSLNLLNVEDKEFDKQLSYEINLFRKLRNEISNSD